jgi:1,4-alpha-glucan branching enzyme
MNVAVVLHSHLPWVRRNGVHPVGEEWFHQALADSYLPLLEMLERLAGAGCRELLSLGVTPVLAEQLDDPHLLAEFHSWLGRRRLDLGYTVSRYGAPDRAGMAAAWAHEWRRLTGLLERFEARERRSGVLASFRALADAGVIELLGGPATHPYLPLMDDPALIRGQIAGGLATSARLLGRRPRGVWAPECGHRPEGPVADPCAPPRAFGDDGTPELPRSAAVLPGLETFWAEAGVGHLVLDGPSLAAAAGAGSRDWSRAGGETVAPGGPLDVLDRPALLGSSDVAAFGRNLAVSYAVWNPHGGYPADPWYRDFHQADLEGGFKTWRVTARDRLDKAPYDPERARTRALVHAARFVDLLRGHLTVRTPDTVVVAAYDTELFGHWWHEGPVWLEAVLRLVHEDERLRPTTLAAHLERHPPTRRLAVPESSWGWGKGHGAWVGGRTRWLWQALREAEARFLALPPGPGRAAAWRQLTLAQASDWPFMLNREQSAEYAEERVRGHLARFEAACRGEGLDALRARDDPWGTPLPAPLPVG